MAGDSSSVSRTADVERIREALSGPGADTRFWASAGLVTAEPTIEPGGVYAAVQLVPSGIEITARLGVAYAGPGRGVWAPLHKDDEVLVVVPDGDFASGAVIVARLGNAIDTVPDEFDNKKLVVKQATGEDILVLTDSGGKVMLGSANATSHAVKHEELDAALTAWATGTVTPHTHSYIPGTLAAAPTGPAIGITAPDISAAKSPSVVVE